MNKILKHFSVHLLGMSIGATGALANPTNGTVVNGTATFELDGSVLQITNTPGAIINWQDFSISQDEVTRFIQQSASSAVLNRVTGGNLTEILGSLESNGRVFVINPAGLVIGEGAIIDTAGFVGSTLNLSDDDFKAGRGAFTGDGGAIVNRGLVHVSGSGDIILLASSVENSGVLRTDSGDIVLAAGRSAPYGQLSWR